VPTRSSSTARVARASCRTWRLTSCRRAKSGASDAARSRAAGSWVSASSERDVYFSPDHVCLHLVLLFCSRMTVSSAALRPSPTSDWKQAEFRQDELILNPVHVGVIAARRITRGQSERRSSGGLGTFRAWPKADMCASVTSDPLRLSVLGCGPSGPTPGPVGHGRRWPTPHAAPAPCSLVRSVGRVFRLGAWQDAHVQ
jgi:hypothetical protein